MRFVEARALASEPCTLLACEPGEQSVEPAANRRGEDVRIFAAAQLDRIVECGDARGSIEPALQRDDQRKRPQEPVMIAFAQQARIRRLRGAKRVVDPVEHEQRDGSREVEVAGAGVRADRMETGDRLGSVLGNPISG